MVLFVFLACDSEKDNGKDALKVKSAIFKEYLNRVFKSEIPKDKYRYFLLPRNSCHYCIYKGFNIIKDSCGTDNITFITNMYSSQIKEKGVSCEKIYFDKNRLRINKLNLWAPSLILCKDRKILSIKELTAKGFVKRLPGQG